ncbi:MAG: radical SAM protein [Bacteroidales bacterium]|nr:radical SAM protein [Bacteroidales bacterium]
MYKYLFGPVPSRRLGMSLGVDLVPNKICTLDCVYCEVGKTSKLTSDRKEYIECSKVIKELNHYLLNNPSPNCITLTGSEEPTLNSKIGEIIKLIKQQHIGLPVAVITNGTLLNDPKVRTELKDVDIVLPSLDAATKGIFEAINKPHSQINIEHHISGLIEFSKYFNGKLCLEVMVLPGYNNHHKELLELKRLLIK